MVSETIGHSDSASSDYTPILDRVNFRTVEPADSFYDERRKTVVAPVSAPLQCADGSLRRVGPANRAAAGSGLERAAYAGGIRRGHIGSRRGVQGAPPVALADDYRSGHRHLGERLSSNQVTAAEFFSGA